MCLDVFGVGWLSSSSASTVVWCVRGLPSGATGPTMHWIRWRFPCVTGHTTLWFMHHEKTDARLVWFVEIVVGQVPWHCVVFSGWRVMYVNGVAAVSHRSCLSATRDRCVSSPLLAGLSRSVGCAFLRICTYRGTPGAFGPWTAPRTSHSLSSLRACHLRLHGDTGHCSVSHYALWRT